MLKNNQGFSLISIIMAMLIIGFTLLYGFKIGSGYITKSTIENVVNTVLAEAVQENDKRAIEIKENLLKRLNITNIEITPEDVIVEKVGSDYHIEVFYQKRIKIKKDIELLMNLSVIKDSTSF